MISSSSSTTITATTSTSQATVQEAVVTTASPTVPSVTSISVTSSTTTVVNSTVSSSSTTSIGRGEGRGYVRDQRTSRDDRRINSTGPNRRESDRGRDKVSGAGRGRINQDRRDNRLSGNKENRPWREERADADGWITKGPKEPRGHRNHQSHSLHSSDSKEIKTPHLVNGDSTPPPSPKPQLNETKVSQSTSDETTDKDTPSLPLNNNDGVSIHLLVFT